MPAAAVIPAPIAYINVVAVKKLVVEVKMVCWGWKYLYFLLSLDYRLPGKLNNPSGDYRARLVFYCEKIRVFKANY